MGQIKVKKNVGGIEGLCIIEPTVHGDSRGYFMETYNQRDMEEAGLNMVFVQDNQSSSTKGVLRGLHFQKEYPQGKLVRVVKGSVFDVAVDLRSNSETYGKWFGVELTEENKKQYVLFLSNLLKDRSYVQLTYMTGILPIAKYSSGSELNMFWEYTMASEAKYNEYFGFTDSEVDQLYEKYTRNTREIHISREDLKEWYYGYTTKSGERMYNPRSVVCALRDNQLANYWTSSGTYDSIFNYIKGNIADVRNDLVLMVAGEHVPAKMQQYAATANALHTKDQIYSAMVVYGLLTYENGKVFIPNKELMDKFDELLLSNQQLGYVYRLARESQRMLQATIHGDTDTMEEILEYVHDTEVPIYSYNSEVELSAIVNLVYLSARDEYRVEREDKAGKGFVDFIFYPKRNNIPGIILELKIDHTPQKAIEQIKEKNYQLRFQGKIGEIPVYEGSILAVGISYDKKTKKHSCEVEML